MNKPKKIVTSRACNQEKQESPRYADLSKGGYPVPCLRGYPVPCLGGTPSHVRGGTLSHVWGYLIQVQVGGYPIPGLAGGYPIQTWLGGYSGYPPVKTWDGVPPSQTWDGVLPRPDWGTPPPPEMWTDKQTENSTFPHPSDAGGKNNQGKENNRNRLQKPKGLNLCKCILITECR